MLTAVLFLLKYQQCFIRKASIPPGYGTYHTKGNQVVFYRPRVILFSDLRIGKIKLSSWISFGIAWYTSRKLKYAPGVFYGHFWGRLSTYPVAIEKRIPLYGATG